MKFRFRIMISAVLMLICFYAFYSTWMIGQMTPRYLEITEDGMVESAVSYAEMVSRYSSDSDLNLKFLTEHFNGLNKKSVNAKIYAVEKSKIAFGLYVTDSKGIVLYDSLDQNQIGQDFSQWNDVFLSLQGKYGARTTYENANDPLSGTMYVSSPIIVKEKILGCLTIYKPIQTIAPYLESFQKKFLMIGVLVLLMISMFFVLILTWILIPLKRLVDYSRSLSDHFVHKSGKVNNVDEFEMISQDLREISNQLDTKLYVENYLQVLTHELKGPVSAIKGAAEILEENTKDAEMRKFCQNISFEIQRIQNLIIKFLDLASLEFRKESIVMEKLNVMLLLEHAVNAAQSKCKEKNVLISLSGNREILIFGNEVLLEEAICNILHNSIEFSVSGKKVVLSCEQLGEQVKITCRDFGVGIPDYAIEKVFQKFFSLPRPDSKMKGTGLGLAFVKEVINLHKGSISIQNVADGGVEVAIFIKMLNQVS